MNITRRLEALERFCPDDQMPIQERISRAALTRLTDEELESLFGMQQETLINRDYKPSKVEADAMLAYRRHVDELAIEGGGAIHTS